MHEQVSERVVVEMGLGVQDAIGSSSGTGTELHSGVALTMMSNMV